MKLADQWMKGLYWKYGEIHKMEKCMVFISGKVFAQFLSSVLLENAARWSYSLSELPKAHLSLDETCLFFFAAKSLVFGLLAFYWGVEWSSYSWVDSVYVRKQHPILFFTTTHSFLLFWGVTDFIISLYKQKQRFAFQWPFCYAQFFNSWACIEECISSKIADQILGS